MNEIQEFLNHYPQVLLYLFMALFMIVALAMLVANIAIFSKKGKKIESIFDGVDLSKPKFREKGVSGYSTRSLFTKFGGASHVLDVIVTDSELCIQGIFPPFTFVLSHSDLVHRIPLSELVSVTKTKSKVQIGLSDSKGDRSLYLQLKDAEGFMRAVQG